MSAPIPFPRYPKKLDKAGRLRIKIAGRHYYLPKPLGSPESIAEYERLRLEHALGKIATPKIATSHQPMTIAQLIAARLAADPRGLQDKEVRAIARACSPLEAIFGATPAAEFTTLRLRALQDAMIAGTWAPALDPWSRTYVNAQIGRVCRVFRWAETEGHVQPGTWGHLRALPPIKRNDRRCHHVVPRQPVDWETQAVPCLKHMAPQVEAMVKVQLYGGMRPGEVCVMRRCEIDQAGPHETWLYRPGQHKGSHRGHDLIKVLGPQAQTALAPWLMAAEPEGFVFPPAKARYRRGHYTVEGYGRAIARAIEAAGVAPWSAYCLRHLGKQLATREFGLDHARAFLGQMSLGATAGYAAMIDLKTAAEVARKIG